jgi:hypothetical protein
LSHFFFLLDIGSKKIPRRTAGVDDRFLLTPAHWQTQGKVDTATARRKGDASGILVLTDGAIYDLSAKARVEATAGREEL